MRLLSLLAVSTILTACGGSSSDTSTGTPTSVDSAPVVGAGADQTVVEGSSVTLTATASDADGDAISYAWTQTGSETLTISGATNESTLTFTAPDVAANTTYDFTITVTANNVTAADEVSVTVTDATANAEALAEFEVLFADASLAKPLEIESCEIGGSTTNCLSIEINSYPSFTVGPFCPRSTTDTTAEAGIWIKDGSGIVSEVDGPFITNLSTFYDDPNWQMFDAATNEVFYTDTTAQCQLAANPDPSAELANFCVECTVTHLDEIEADGEITTSYLIPLNPVDAASANTNTSYGVSFSGVTFDRSAPISIIESNYNIAPFDDCGGHINPNVGYHFHAVTEESDCHGEVETTDGHAAQIGLALDGYPIYDRLNGDLEPTGLDTCNGVDSVDEGFGAEIGYHYHVNEGGENQILPCLTGEVEGDIGGGPGGPPGG